MSAGSPMAGGIDFDLGRHLTIALDVTAYSTDFNAGGAGLMLKGRLQDLPGRTRAPPSRF